MHFLTSVRMSQDTRGTEPSVLIIAKTCQTKCFLHLIPLRMESTCPSKLSNLHNALISLVIAVRGIWPHTCAKALQTKGGNLSAPLGLPPMQYGKWLAATWMVRSNIPYRTQFPILRVWLQLLELRLLQKLVQILFLVGLHSQPLSLIRFLRLGNPLTQRALPHLTLVRTMIMALHLQEDACGSFKLFLTIFSMGIWHGSHKLSGAQAMELPQRVHLLRAVRMLHALFALPQCEIKLKYAPYNLFN